jgi:hypothetical protein
MVICTASFTPTSMAARLICRGWNLCTSCDKKAIWPACPFGLTGKASRQNGQLAWLPYLRELRPSEEMKDKVKKCFLSDVVTMMCSCAAVAIVLMACKGVYCVFGENIADAMVAFMFF